MRCRAPHATAAVVAAADGAEMLRPAVAVPAVAARRAPPRSLAEVVARGRPRRRQVAIAPVRDPAWCLGVPVADRAVVEERGRTLVYVRAAAPTGQEAALAIDLATSAIVLGRLIGQVSANGQAPEIDLVREQAIAQVAEAARELVAAIGLARATALESALARERATGPMAADVQA